MQKYLRNDIRKLNPPLHKAERIFYEWENAFRKVTLLRLFYLNKAGCFLKRQKKFKAKWEFNIDMYLYNPLPINDLWGSGIVSPNAINIQDYFITVLLSQKTKQKMFRYVEGAVKSAK